MNNILKFMYGVLTVMAILFSWITLVAIPVVAIYGSFRVDPYLLLVLPVVSYTAISTIVPFGDLDPYSDPCLSGKEVAALTAAILLIILNVIAIIASV